MPAVAKTCFKCGLEKPLDEFYRHSQMADGHLNKCKSCALLDMRIYRVTQPTVHEYDRRRALLPHRVEAQRHRSRRWRAEHLDAYRAHNAANNALRDGKLDGAPEACEGCGLPARLEKHHPDYSRPLLVIWLCKPCHSIADVIRRRVAAPTVMCAECGREFYPPDPREVLCSECAQRVRPDHDEPGVDLGEIRGTVTNLRRRWQEDE